MKKFYKSPCMSILLLSAVLLFADNVSAAHMGISPTSTQLSYASTAPTAGSEIFVNDPGKFLLERIMINGKAYYRVVINDGTANVDEMKMVSITRANSAQNPDVGGKGVAIEMAILQDKGSGAGSDIFNQIIKVYTEDFAKSHGSITSTDFNQSVKESNTANISEFTADFTMQMAWTTSVQKKIVLGGTDSELLDPNKSFQHSFDFTYDAEQVGLNKKTIVIKKNITDNTTLGSQTLAFTDDFFARIIGTENVSVIDELSDKLGLGEINSGNKDFDEVFEMEITRVTTGTYTSPWNGKTVTYNGDKVIAVGFTGKVSLSDFNDFFGYNFVEDLTDIGADNVDKAERLWFSSLDSPTVLLPVDLVAGQP